MADRAPDPDFLARWGVGNVGQTAPAQDPGTRTLDNNQFTARWLSDTSPSNRPVEDLNSWRSAIRAATGSAIEGVPIVGPYVRAGVDRLRAGVNSLAKGTSYQDELAFRQKAFEQATQAHPATALGGTLTGAIAPMVALGGIPAMSNALGITGTLGMRTAAGLGSNALIGGADTAVRTGGDVGESLKGAAISGVLGGGAPIVGRGLSAATNYALRPAQDALTQRLLGVAARNDIPIGVAQTSTSPFVRKVSQIAGQFPGSGQNVFQGEQVNRFTRAVARTFGEDAENLTPEVMQRARTRLGHEFDHVAENTTIRVDEPFQRDLATILGEARSVLPAAEVTPLGRQIEAIVSKIDHDGTISGETYQALTRKGAPLDRVMQSTNPNVKYYGGQLRDALEDAMQRSATPEMAQRLGEARRQYKNMMTVAPLVVKGTPGEVSPLALQQRVNSSFSGRAFRGGGELGELADVGQMFFRRPADSGTPLGNLVVDQMMRHGNALAAAGLAAATGGGYLAGFDPVDILKGTGGLAAAGLLARGSTSVLNRPQSINALVSRTPYVLPYATGPSANQLAISQDQRRQ